MPHRQMRHPEKRRKQPDHQTYQSRAAVKSTAVELHIDESGAIGVIPKVMMFDLYAPNLAFRLR